MILVRYVEFDDAGRLKAISGVAKARDFRK